ncbi:hypothetical protein [Streptomyces fuscigenes]|uniref:hypothetical protein n=1 Tax=Streptomyces fuscigenes TaxID=1528880 RepID=UPI001F208C5E|nr:hypothetical protein [Streptomyces fuscigenes]MCF3963492.1 hypothetical protein [Streptomyces fuscigenes]
MRRTSGTKTLALTALTLLLAGCGTGHGGSAGPPPPASSSPVAPPTPPAPPSPGAPSSPPVPSPPSAPPAPSSPGAPPSPSGGSCAAASGALGAADTGHTYCLAAGDMIRVGLDGTAARPWGPVVSEGGGLERLGGGSGGPGDASARFRAAAAGTVRLTSSRPLCPRDPGRMSCTALQEWTVTVVVAKG